MVGFSSQPISGCKGKLETMEVLLLSQTSTIKRWTKTNHQLLHQCTGRAITAFKAVARRSLQQQSFAGPGWLGTVDCSASQSNDSQSSDVSNMTVMASSQDQVDASMKPFMGQLSNFQGASSCYIQWPPIHSVSRPSQGNLYHDGIMQLDPHMST